MPSPIPFTWWQIVRLGLVQTALGAVVVLMTSTINRVMVVELALPATVPGALVALHYAVQVLRPRWGYGSDVGGRRTPWIVGGMAALALGGFGAAVATAWTATNAVAGLTLAVLSFLTVGMGVGAAGTSLLVLLATGVEDRRRGAAATIVWVMMIVGFAVTAPLAGHFLDPFSTTRLVAVSGTVSLVAFLVAVLAVSGVEPVRRMPTTEAIKERKPFFDVLKQVWAEPVSRRFTLFIFVSMLAYSAQDLILEPYAGLVFEMTPGVSTKLTGLQHGGVLAGMLLVAGITVGIGGPILGSLKAWTALGCAGSALALFAIAAGGPVGPSFPLREAVFALGFSNGIYAVAAIGSMMGLAGQGGEAERGTRMGVWGAAQGVAFGAGGFLGTLAVDSAKLFAPSAMHAYASVFAAEAVLFLLAMVIALRIEHVPARARRNPLAEAARFQLSPDWKRGSPMPAYDEYEYFDVVVVGGGPSGSKAATDLARAGRHVLLLDKPGRIKPCGGAIPPRLIRDFAIPDDLIVAKIRSARMISPKDQRVDMPVGEGFVGMVNREHFDPWLRNRAALAGADVREASYDRIIRDESGTTYVHYTTGTGADLERHVVRTRLVIGADGAKSPVGRAEIPGHEKMKSVFAYHEIIRRPADGSGDYEATRCDVYYQGKHSPDFYSWVFPHGETLSVGTGSAHKGFSLRSSIRALREASGLDAGETVRREGAPIPLKPLKRWDNGRDVLLAGDAAGVVAPASGEGIYYAMLGGRLSAEAADVFLRTGDPRALTQARRNFMKLHGRVFWILGMMQWVWYRNDSLRERFVSICRDKDVQQLTWDSYMNKELVRKKPVAHVKIFFKDLAHLVRWVSP